MEANFHIVSLASTVPQCNLLGMRFRLKELRHARGLTQEQMAEMMGISVSLYNGLEKGKRRMNADYIESAANIFRVLPSQLFEEDATTIAIAGKVGAGARVPVFDAYAKGGGPQVECPPGLSPHNIVAVEIEGDSMEPVYSAGDLLFYTRWSDGSVPSEAVGRRCVCECEEGLGWVKVVRQGREPGLFDLHSFNDQTPVMYGVRLKWAAPIKLHWPAELARRI
ncbi:XRE family transcriptional regulator [Rhodovulum kholense]|uniref:Helix-turn-helix protein n=1 Tax=Rhodovulum kholense TaxID=453584 RepID=A0A8E3APL9_9RHOB|nr:XRE family transcriptional regulator [Rhodovulum kholense]PTW45673.1 helix-turn-helix protein [Rhodovulum kholense]